MKHLFQSFPPAGNSRFPYMETTVPPRKKRAFPLKGTGVTL